MAEQNLDNGKGESSNESLIMIIFMILLLSVSVISIIIAVRGTKKVSKKDYWEIFCCQNEGTNAVVDAMQMISLSPYIKEISGNDTISGDYEKYYYCSGGIYGSCVVKLSNKAVKDRSLKNLIDGDVYKETDYSLQPVNLYGVTKNMPEAIKLAADRLHDLNNKLYYSDLYIDVTGLEAENETDKIANIGGALSSFVLYMISVSAFLMFAGLLVLYCMRKRKEQKRI